ncbi:MAG: ABC transporter substrate-binding protein [Nitrososphaera sp.]|nr:ABC transporter substrate-binding protein [Nitrososphaera sp.]
MNSLVMLRLVFSLLVPMLGFVSTSAAQTSPVTINAGRIALVGNAPHFVMEKFNLLQKFSPMPVNINYVTTGSGSFLIQGLASGKLDVAVLGTGPALVVAGKPNSNVKIIGTDATWYAPLLTWREDVKSFKDIKPDMKIGSPGGFASNSGAILLKRWVELGRPVGELRGMLVSAGQPDLHKAFQGRKIDLWYSTEPVLLRATGANIIETFDDAFEGAFVVTVNAGTVSFAANHPEIFRAYVRALEAAYEWTARNPKEAAEIVASALKLPVDTVMDAFKEGKYRWGLTLGRTVIEKMATFMKQQDLVGESNLQAIWFKETWETTR